MIGKHYQNESLDISIISKSAQIVRDFIEDYHERNEENQVFPSLQACGQIG